MKKRGLLLILILSCGLFSCFEDRCADQDRENKIVINYDEAELLAYNTNGFDPSILKLGDSVSKQTFGMGIKLNLLLGPEENLYLKEFDCNANQYNYEDSVSKIEIIMTDSKSSKEETVTEYFDILPLFNYRSSGDHLLYSDFEHYDGFTLDLISPEAMPEIAYFRLEASLLSGLILKDSTSEIRFY